MGRPNRSDEKRRLLLPRLARAFADLGYRRTTTAELARRCRVPENTLYRLWADKKVMFIAAIRYVYELSEQTWQRVRLAGSSRSSPAAAETAAERLLAHEAVHQGEFSHYRILFAGLNETDDAEIRSALAETYRKFARFLEQEIGQHRVQRGRSAPGENGQLLDAMHAAWALVGLGTVANVLRELGLAGGAARAAIVASVGRYLLGGATPAKPSARRGRAPAAARRAGKSRTT